MEAVWAVVSVVGAFFFIAWYLRLMSRIQRLEERLEDVSYRLSNFERELPGYPQDDEDEEDADD